VLDIGAARGVHGVRVPCEPAGVLARVDPSWHPHDDWRARICSRLLARRIRQRGVMTPANVFGLAWSGAMTQPRLEGLLRRLPDGVSEIYAHPATSDGFAGASGGHADELAALIAPSVVKLLRGSSIATGGYSDFSAA
jgi:chitin disaccharide deacetylase